MCCKQIWCLSETEIELKLVLQLCEHGANDYSRTTNILQTYGGINSIEHNGTLSGLSYAKILYATRGTEELLEH